MCGWGPFEISGHCWMGSSATSSNLVMSFSFQIYLPGETIESAVDMKKKKE